MLFLAVHYFEYEGYFDMYVFDETETISDPIRGKIARGGYTKRHWLRWSELVFHCKPLHAFLLPFRLLLSKRHTYAARANDSEEGRKVWLQFESSIKNDVHSLLSYFDDVLNNPDLDWTGQETRFTSQDDQELQPNPSYTTVPRTDDNKKPDPEPCVKTAATNRKGDKKRKRAEPRVLDEPQTKRTKQEASKPVARIPRRRRPPPPSDRVLRPRPWRI